MPPLKIARSQVLAYRCRAQHLDARLPWGSASLARAAHVGLQDSVPRSALHSLHARVEDVGPSDWEHPALVQVWGLRYTAYVVPAGDHAIFTLSRLPERGAIRERAYELAAWLDDFLDGRTLDLNVVAAALDAHPNRLRYASLTGTVIIRWDGARRPQVWTVRAPEVEPSVARQDLARRYLHAYGPTAPEALAEWAGISVAAAEATFDALGAELISVRTPLGDGWALASDEPGLRTATESSAVRLLPSGDPYYLLRGPDRDLLVPDPGRRAQLWTSRVWPGAVVAGGEVVGTWRRTRAVVTVEPWRPLSPAERAAVESEASTLPLPDVTGPVAVRWGAGR